MMPDGDLQEGGVPTIVVFNFDSHRDGMREGRGEEDMHNVSLFPIIDFSKD